MINGKFEKNAVISAISAILIVLCFSGCSHSGNRVGKIEGNFTENQVSENERAAANELTVPENVPETAAEAEETSLLSIEDINLHAVDETGRNYVFVYHQDEFSAQYTEDNWKIVDSYRITDTEDMTVICQALLDVHPVHGRDMQSFRTAEDMVFEWLQHNIAYAFLPDDSPWKRSAKDVDLNPADQNKTFEEIYEDRTGKTFRIEDFLRLD